MLYTLQITLEAYHRPTERWHVHEARHGLRAVSRRQALDKGLTVLRGWPGYADRDGHPDWDVSGTVKILEIAS